MARRSLALRRRWCSWFACSIRPGPPRGGRSCSCRPVPRSHSGLSVEQLFDRSARAIELPIEALDGVAVFLGIDPGSLFQLPGEQEPSIDDLRTLETGRASDASDPISRMLASRPPVEYFGRYWAQELARGFRAATKLNADQYREVRFEELIAQPKETLRAIAASNYVAWVVVSLIVVWLVMS